MTTRHSHSPIFAATGNTISSAILLRDTAEAFALLAIALLAVAGAYTLGAAAVTLASA